MTPPPAEVVQWLKRTYPQPTVDPEWLEGCYSWIQDELHLNPARDMTAILENVNTQLLESDLADSMVAGTGIPHNVLGAAQAILKGPILVEITGVTEIGHSAYSLLQIYESREEYHKQAALREANGDQEERKPMPKFPRSMLQLQLSDGASVLPAIEFRNLPEFELGETPLGYKMVIRNVTIRRGTALLEPLCVDLKGHRTADRDEQRDLTFLRSLKLRLGEAVPEEPPEEEAAIEHVPAPVPGPADPILVRDMPPRAVARALPSPHEVRSPLREISPPPRPQAGPLNAVAINLVEHADDIAEPRQRKLPNHTTRTPSPAPQVQRSRYFVKPSSSSRPTGSESPVVTVTGPGSADDMRAFASAIRLSPRRMPPIEIPASDDEDDSFANVSTRTHVAANRQKSKQKEKQKATVVREPSSDDFGSDFEMDENFLEQVNRFEQEALMRESMRGRSQTRVATQTQVKIDIQSQATSATLYNAASTSTVVSGPSRTTSTPGSNPVSCATSTPGTSSSNFKNAYQATSADMDVITISDDEEEIDKENMPVPTRHVRRRIVRRPEEDVIELSD